MPISANLFPSTPSFAASTGQKFRSRTKVPSPKLFVMMTLGAPPKGTGIIFGPEGSNHNTQTVYKRLGTRDFTLTVTLFPAGAQSDIKVPKALNQSPLVIGPEGSAWVAPITGPSG